ncbi:hypothetical protein [Microbacterium sp. Leaf159]|uniref:hypothetical protein n=1 Tax=Microbacterium sp. Leaf159 TaxID=1736279 RepID=UPI0012FB713A|nr:hypothetical protein [Microbacterium sp. Leaf159]
MHTEFGEFVEGVELPAVQGTLPEGRELVFQLTPRMKSLEWAARKRPELFGGALLAFAQRRYDAMQATPDLLPPRAWGVLSVIPATDRLRTTLGGTWDPRAAPTNWPNHLFLGVDDIVQVCWFLRAGLPVPAALIARRLFERWTLNVAHQFGLSRQETESEEAYITRVWLTLRHPSLPDEAGRWWAWLSEFLHARPGHPAFGDRAAQPLSPIATQNVAHHDAISAVVDIVLGYIRGGIDLLAEQQGIDDASLSLRSVHRDMTIAEPFGLSFAFVPLEYFEAYRKRSEQWVRGGQAYRADVTDEVWGLVEKTNSLMTVRAFLERRGRAIERARGAFDDEKAALGEEFSPGDLASRMFRQRTIAETARQIVPDASGVERDALIVAAQAADGATHLWLEDSDDAVGCIRVLLEQVARLRTHRLKPGRAQRLEAAGTPSSSRWLSESGWGRLAVLMRALNEYAHLSIRSRRRGAAALLREVQSNVDGEESRRGSAVNAAFMIFAFELFDRLTDTNPEVAREFSRQVTLFDRDLHLEIIEEYLNRVFTRRAHDFGDPDYGRGQSSAQRS